MLGAWNWLGSYQLEIVARATCFRQRTGWLSEPVFLLQKIQLQANVYILQSSFGYPIIQLRQSEVMQCLCCIVDVRQTARDVQARFDTCAGDITT